MRILECVPNVSEGRREEIINSIRGSLDSIPGVHVLHVDIGGDANRTVITFAGEPQQVVEGAYRLISMATKLIDLREHQGEHPRIGATDVCPLVPIAGVTMEEAVELSRELGQRVGEELHIPVYLYERAATAPHRESLPAIRSGEFEGLAAKMKEPQWQPDFGPREPHLTAGAIVIGARPFLIAYNVNLETRDVSIAKQIATRIRETGREVVNAEGVRSRVPGLLPRVRAIGWATEEFNCVQVSVNVLDYKVSGLHHVFEACEREAASMGVALRGSGLVGLVPEEALLDAGRHFAAISAANSVTGSAAAEGSLASSALIAHAIAALGLEAVRKFDPEERILERCVACAQQTRR